jgi:hypothetical protein
MAGFNANGSRICEDTLAEFLSSPVTDDILGVPGVGPATAVKLAAHNIKTPRQLIGAFLMVCGPDMNDKMCADAFWFYLAEIGVPGGTRSTIVHAIAEKHNILLPRVNRNKTDSDEEVEYSTAEEDGTVEVTVPEFDNDEEEFYYHVLIDACAEDGLPSDIRVFDWDAVWTINHTKGRLPPGFKIDDKVVYYANKMVFTEKCFLNYCCDYDIVVPQYVVQSLDDDK